MHHITCTKMFVAIPLVLAKTNEQNSVDSQNVQCKKKSKKDK